MQPVKNKKLTYLLICAVAIIWGIVVYRLFFAEDPESDMPAFSQRKEAHEPFDKYVSKNDTFHLALNYRDPFLGKMYVAKESTVKDSTIRHKVKPFKEPPPAIDWSVIKYSGYITNPVTKKMVAIVTVEGRERMLAVGESLSGVKLIKNNRDSILVNWHGQLKYIKQ